MDASGLPVVDQGIAPHLGPVSADRFGVSDRTMIISLPVRGIIAVGKEKMGVKKKHGKGRYNFVRV